MGHGPEKNPTQKNKRTLEQTVKKHAPQTKPGARKNHRGEEHITYQTSKHRHKRYFALLNED